MRNVLTTFHRGALLSALVIALTAVVGCGGGESEQASEPAAEAPAAESQDAVVIEANDQLQFSLNEFTVQAGEEVTVTLKNVGTLPKETFGHNLVILQMGQDVAEFANDGMTASDNDYIPADAGDRIVANTHLLGPGEEATITFTAPSEPGDYPFLCSFPGHYATMNGTMKVE
jgi:azurin